jgi:FAD/FMN-containing dehydrogenase
VTADGRVLTASEADHPDLFWAIRGGGGNFGAVTSFAFRLHPLGPEIFAAIVVYPGDRTAEIVRAWRDYLAQAPDEVTCDLLIWGMPPLPPVPPEMHWAPVVIAAAMYAGPVEEGERALRPLRAFGAPVADLSGPMPYVAMQSSLDALFPSGQLYYWKSLFGNRLTDDVVTAIAALGAARPTPQTLIALRGLGGALGRVPEEATAYGNRDALFNLSLDATWQEPADSERNVAWTRQSWARMRALTGGGAYVNFAGLGEENDALARSAYGRNFDRLCAIKRKYDPENAFSGNINIVP